MASGAAIGLGGLAGGAVGAALAITLSRRSVATSIAAGAGVGAAIAAGVLASRAKQEEPWWHDPKNVRTFEDVARDDAHFREAAMQQVGESDEEALALQRLFGGKRIDDACNAINATAKLGSTRARFDAHWRNAPRSELAAAVQSVVADLDAPHLLPSGIEKRLNDGVDAASWGLFTLIGHSAFDVKSGP